MIIVSEICVVFLGIMLALGLIQYISDKGAMEDKDYLLQAANELLSQELLNQKKQLAMKEEADRIQSTKVFYLDVKVRHGSAFGGFCSTMNDGRKKRGRISLDGILMYGKHPSGREFTYYIEEQNIEIAATDDPEVVMVRSNDGSKFEIRQNGQGRDEGKRVSNAFLKKDIEYFIILESKHEISLKAVKGS